MLETGIFDTHPQHNPLSGANKFFLPYCTSDGHMGSRDPSAETFGWQFRGQHTVSAALEVMVKQHGLGSKPGHKLLFGGGSAGSRGGMASESLITSLPRFKMAPKSGCEMRLLPAPIGAGGSQPKHDSDPVYKQIIPQCVND